MIHQNYEDKSGTLKFGNALKKVPASAFDSVMNTITQYSLDMEVMRGTRRGSSAFNTRMELCQAWTNGWTRGTGKTASIVVGRMKEDESKNTLFIVVTDDVAKLLDEVRKIGAIASIQLS